MNSNYKKNCEQYIPWKVGKNCDLCTLLEFRTSGVHS